MNLNLGSPGAILAIVALVMAIVLAVMGQIGLWPAVLVVLLALARLF